MLIDHSSIAEKAVYKRFEPDAPDQKDLLVSGMPISPFSEPRNLADHSKGAFVRHGLQPRVTMSETLFTMLAGSDTTASSMRFTLLSLITNPRVYREMKSVVAQAVSEGRVSSPIKQEEARKIPYIQVCPRSCYPLVF